MKKNIWMRLMIKIIVFLFVFLGESIANDRVAILDDPIKSLQARISVIKKQQPLWILRLISMAMMKPHHRHF
ncbi:MAG: hypothetical protein IPG48_04460 [Saprospiraceae bacterium]|nr:hypothetical protein [Saprospiraceae bacterium]